MPAFRNVFPARRVFLHQVSSHSDHRGNLRIDFNQRCGYCNDLDYYKITYYEIDHFIPKDKLVTISDTDYSNLVYACRSCNNAKRAKWPSGDELVAIVDDKGFIDPCNRDYDIHFDRDIVGNIIPNTQLAKWIYLELKFSKPQHQLIYQLETLDEMIDNLSEEVSRNPEIETKLLNLLKIYRQYTRELREI